MIAVYTQTDIGYKWLEKYRGKLPVFGCILGFTETGIIPGISAAGATPSDRQYTAVADAEFLFCGPQIKPLYPLPPLDVGVSPVIISRAILAAQSIPIYIFNAGLPVIPSVGAIDLGGTPARCLSSGQALDINIVDHLFQQGLIWGDKLAANAKNSYVILGECVVGGTTTALAVTMALGINSAGKINSSHPSCNHGQKLALVETGLKNAGFLQGKAINKKNPLEIVAAVGDPMQIVVAGMAIAASRQVGVLLAGGTQMLAVYALCRAIASRYSLAWTPEEIVVGTTRWVAEDVTGDTVGLAEEIGEVCLLATQLSFANSRYRQLWVYEEGYVKEGMGAGGCAIAAYLYQNWQEYEILQAIEGLIK